MYPPFIFIGGVAIAVDRIAYVDFRQPGNATVHIDSNSVSTDDEEEIEMLHALVSPDEPEEDEPETADPVPAPVE